MNTEQLKDELQASANAQSLDRETPKTGSGQPSSRRQADQLQKLSLITFAVKNGYDYDKYDSLDKIYLEANSYLENNAVCQ